MKRRNLALISYSIDPSLGHVPFSGGEFGLGNGLLYCKRCMFLLWGDRVGYRPKSELPCIEAKITLRNPIDNSDRPG